MATTLESAVNGPSGLKLADLPQGYKYTNLEDSSSNNFDENYMDNGSFRLDFEGVRNEAIIGGYIKCDGPSNEEVAGKLGGGTHTKSKKKNGRCYDMGVRFNGKEVRVRKEFPHPEMHDGPEKNIDLGDLRKKWIGYQFLKINTKKDNRDAVNVQVWIDMAGLDDQGKPKNQWQKIFDETDTGDWEGNTDPWLTTFDSNDGQSTIRVDHQTQRTFDHKHVFCATIEKA